MISLPRAALLALVACICLLGRPVEAQDTPYPNRPINFIVPWGAGGGSDQAAREIAKLLSDELKVPVTVLNMPGATGSIGISKLVQGDADGYTLGLMAADTYALLASPDQPHQWKDDDYLPLAVMIKQTSAIIVAANSRFKTWHDLVAAAKAKPDTISIAVGGAGSPQDLTINYLRARGIRVLSVPYAKPGERYSAVLGGQIDGFYEAVGNARGFLDSKKMHPILMFCERRLPEFADVPCSREAGIDITLPQFRAVIVKAGTDPRKLESLQRALAKVAASAEYKRYLQTQYADPDSYIPMESARQFMTEQLNVMRGIAAASK